MELLYVLLGGLATFFFLKKGNSDSAQEENLKVKEKLLNIKKDVLKKEVELELEDKKREDLKKEITEKTNETLSAEDIINYFNNRKS